MKKHGVVLTLILLFMFSIINAKDNNQTDSYNMNRGVELMQNGDLQQALQYFNKELTTNPKNGYAWFYIAAIKSDLSEYGQALTAIDNSLKYIGKKDKDVVSAAWSIRGTINFSLENNEEAYKDYSNAIKITPEDIDRYSERGELLYRMEKYDESDADYNKIKSIDQGNALAYIGLGRNMNGRKRFQDAIDNFNYAIKLDENSSSAYALRAESYIALKKYSEAADDAIKSISLDNNNDGIRNLIIIADSSQVHAITKLKVKQMQETSNITWPYLLGLCYESVEKYKSAEKWYKKAFEIEESDVIASRISSCIFEQGLYDEAFKYIDKAYELDSTATDYILSKAQMEYEAGRHDASIRDYDIYISKKPDVAYGYIARGKAKRSKKDFDGALEDLTMAITLDGNSHSAYLYRGRIYKEKGEKEKADADFNEVLKLDTLKDEQHLSAFYALALLDRKDKVIAITDSLLKSKKDIPNLYNAACAYSMTGDKERALGYLEEAFEKGYRHFAHIKVDEDLDNIRETKEFKDIINKYTEIYKKEQNDAETEEDGIEYEEKVVEIPFTKEDGVLKVKCNINGLPLHFVFDTGATDVLLSSIEASFMMKNNYISASDVMGKANYTTASGEITEGTLINLRKVNVGGLDLNDVRASVVKSQNAPLLLGQSVLKKLGKVEIDYNKNVIKITHRVKK